MLARADAVRADIEKVDENRRISIESGAQSRRNAIEAICATAPTPAPTKASPAKKDDASR
ncbi:hypothetical protein [uncultured Amnibacterium sp.]|uniref:hypothetical protein n=1 Tax=uncultured Amnibacterium sp. TaxID=1631851 RepID=UPI0035CB68C7